MGSRGTRPHNDSPAHSAIAVCALCSAGWYVLKRLLVDQSHRSTADHGCPFKLQTQYALENISNHTNKFNEPYHVHVQIFPLVATITAEDYRFISSGNRQDQQPRQRKGQGLAGAAVVSAAGILTDSLPIDLLPEQIQQSRSDGPQKADRHRQGGGSRLTTMTSSFQAPRLLRTCQYQHFLRRLNPAPAPNPAIFLHRGARERRSREWSRVQTRPWVRTGQAAQRLRRRIRQQGGGGEAGGGRSIQR